MRPAKLVVRLRVNGQPHESLIEPRKLLCDFLRYDLGLTGTHVGCEHGACGACTVVVNGEAVKSCLMLAVQAREADVLTVEGLAGYGQTPSPNPLPPQGAGASDVGLTGRPLAPSPSRGTGASGAGHPGVLPPSPSRGKGGQGGIGVSIRSSGPSTSTTRSSAASVRRACCWPP
ncbi:MAG TPA: 2Fe-2S iron-sulfur cluster-binding protein [Chloroflexota bacterium]